MGESGGITPELHLIYTHRYIILTSINQVVKIMTISDKAKSLCKSKEAQQSTGAVGKLQALLLPSEYIIRF